MKKKSLRQWVKEHRQDIDITVKNNFDIKPSNDEDREDWILNFEPLYLWAKGDRVDV